MAGLESKAISFPAAISRTQNLLDCYEQLSAEELQSAVADLVQSANGARGFFVAYLSDERSYADTPSEAIIEGLQSAPDLVAELLVKNVAMSTAMALTHQRNGDKAMAANSARVSQRSAKLIQQLQLPQIQTQLHQLSESITKEGKYSSFLQRWGYDAEQRQQIGQVVSGLIVKT